MNLPDTSTNNNEIQYHTCGTGISTILLHGLAASRHDWDCISPLLVERGYQVYLPDLPGHGTSPGPDEPGRFTTSHLTTTVDHWIETQKIRGPIVLVGHSLGAYLCLYMAHQHPELITKMVLAAPFFTPKQIFFLARYALRHPSLSEQALRMVNINLVYSVLSISEPITGKYPAQARWQTAKDYTRTTPASMRFPATAEDLNPILAEIPTPTIIIWGKQDFVLNPKYFRVLLESLPNAKIYPLKNCGHEPHLTQANRFNELVLDFLSEN